MKIAIEAARFSPEEANQLRKAMATFRSRGTIEELQDKMVGRMIERGYDAEFSHRCFNQIKGFGEYGFPKAMLQASPARLRLQLAEMPLPRCLSPVAFSTPSPWGSTPPHRSSAMPASMLSRCARPTSVSATGTTSWSPLGQARSRCAWDYARSTAWAREAAERIVAARDATVSGHRGPQDPQRPHHRASAHPCRRRCIPLPGPRPRAGPVGNARAPGRSRSAAFAFHEAREEGVEAPVQLPAMPKCEHVVADYQTLRLSLKAHPMSFLRKALPHRATSWPGPDDQHANGQKVSLAGLVLVRQRPGSAKGVCFITLEDETGVANLVVWPKVMAQYRPVIMGARLLAVKGVIQREKKVIHLVADVLADRTDALDRLSLDRHARAHGPRRSRQTLPANGGLNRHPRNARRSSPSPATSTEEVASPQPACRLPDAGSGSCGKQAPCCGSPPARPGPCPALQAVSCAITSSAVWWSRLPVGSSARSTAGSLANARAMATRCCSPPESRAGRCFKRSSRPRRVRISTARLRATPACPPRRSAAAGPRSRLAENSGKQVMELIDEAQMLAT